MNSIPAYIYIPTIHITSWEEDSRLDRWLPEGSSSSSSLSFEEKRRNASAPVPPKRIKTLEGRREEGRKMLQSSPRTGKPDNRLARQRLDSSLHRGGGRPL